MQDFRSLFNYRSIRPSVSVIAEKKVKTQPQHTTKPAKANHHNVKVLKQRIKAKGKGQEKGKEKEKGRGKGKGKGQGKGKGSGQGKGKEKISLLTSRIRKSMFKPKHTLISHGRIYNVCKTCPSYNRKRLKLGAKV